MAASDTTAPNEKLKHVECLWGEYYVGTKAEIQSIGIGVGRAFPGEPGGPKRLLLTRDPRGFEVKVTERRSSGGCYHASIPFPGREQPTDQWRDFAPGVKRCVDNWWFDAYVGTADALASAGLVGLDQLPGQPGMNKVRVTIFSDGTIPPSRNGNHKRSREPGAKSIERAAKGTYKVRVIVPEDEEEPRREAVKRVEKEWEARMRAMPRPKPLIAANNRKRQAETDEQFKENVFTLLNRSLGMLRVALVNKGGYGYDEETLCEFERLACEMEDVLRDGSIAHGLDEEEPMKARDDGAACKDDARLQSFLKSVTSDLSLVKNEKPEGT